nr:outer membrane protein assembly factor BamD [Saprospiraceae bacterium]
MIKNVSFSALVVVVLSLLVFSSCRSEFEKTRMSGDPERILNAGMEYYDKEEYEKARNLFELVLNTYRGRSEAENLYFRYANAHFHLREHILSAFYFENFANTFPNSQHREKAEFKAAYSNYMLSPSFRLDQKYTHDAIDGFQRFVNRFPNSPRVAECNELMDELRKKLERKAFYQADLYYKMGSYQSAVASFHHLLQDYPETNDAEKVRYLLVKSNFLFAENSILSKQEERYAATITAYDNFLKRHPNSQYHDELSKYIQISKNKLNSLTHE